MTLVLVDVAHLGPDHPVASAGYIQLVPVHRRVADGQVVTREPLAVPLVDGRAAVTLAPGYYLVHEGVRAGAHGMCVLVPDVEQIAYADLITGHQVDPDTLDPGAEPGPAWQVALDLFRAEVEAAQVPVEVVAAAVQAALAALPITHYTHGVPDVIPGTRVGDYAVDLDDPDRTVYRLGGTP